MQKPLSTTLDNPLSNLPQQGAMAQTDMGRAMQEVQGQVFMAKQFPRDIIAADKRIKQACQRLKLAEGAMYAYPRGGQTVTGPSIRLAEVMAQTWGNLKYGVRELTNDKGKKQSEVEAFCWDLETNVYASRTFTQGHQRYTKAKGLTDLQDPRDTYELVANHGARRLRACILEIIPPDIVENAIEMCEKTLKGGGGVPLEDRLKSMVSAFEGIGVTQPMIEERLGHKVAATIEIEMVQMQKIFKSIKDGFSKLEEWFDLKGAESRKLKQDLNLNDPPTPPKTGSKKGAKGPGKKPKNFAPGAETEKENAEKNQGA